MNSSTKAYYSIDYFSFTIPTERPFEDGMFFDQQDNVLKVFVSSFDDIAIREYFTLNWTHENGNRFYQHRLRHDGTDVAISYGKTNAHVLVDLAGKACANFDARDILLPLISRYANRTSRIDFAIDLECDTSPKEFIEARDNKSFKSSGNKYSPTGGTEYIGGRTSERMARVYRYYAPHPRAHLLRVEAEYKGDAAKVAAEHLGTSGLFQTCVDAHTPFKWRHSTYPHEATEGKKLPYRSYDPQNASTVRWLYGDVVTALRKAIKNKLIDPDDWVKYTFGKSLEDDSPSPLT